MAKEKEMKYLCDARVTEDSGRKYFSFIVNYEEYSRFLEKYKEGDIVEVYIKNWP